MAIPGCTHTPWTRSKVTDRHLYMELFPLFEFMPNFQAVPSLQSPAAQQEGSVTEGKSLLGLRVAGMLPSLVKTRQRSIGRASRAGLPVAWEQSLSHAGFPGFAPCFPQPQVSSSPLLPAPPTWLLLILRWLPC